MAFACPVKGTDCSKKLAMKPDPCGRGGGFFSLDQLAPGLLVHQISWQNMAGQKNQSTARCLL